MKKDDAVKMLGGNITKVAKHLGVSRYTVHRWPDELTQPLSDQVRGCYMRITEDRDKQAVSIFGGK